MVAHSMGGDITRSLRFVPGFTSSSNFDKGNVHKLITIGTPHLGSPLAIQLLNTNNACVATLMASKGNISFSTVTLSSGQTYTGGVGDLQGNGTGGGLSEALIALQSSFVIPFPTALVAGVMSSTNLSGVDCSLCAAGYIRNKCGSPSFFNRSAPSDPLAVNLTSTGWPTILGGSSDAVVPLTSEFNGASATSPGMEIKGIVHSAGMEVLDFGGPAEVDYSAVAAQIIVLLNEMVSGVDYNPL